jgi:hypothetical protein
MPWTRRQVKYLLSDVSPLSGAQKDKIKGELHENPKMGHAHKGSDELKRQAAHDMKGISGESHSYSHTRPKRKVLSRYRKSSV